MAVSTESGQTWILGSLTSLDSRRAARLSVIWLGRQQLLRDMQRTTIGFSRKDNFYYVTCNGRLLVSLATKIVHSDLI
jgi:hypothetical protein